MVDMPQNPTQLNQIYLIYIYKEDLALNNLQGLICYETQTRPAKPNLSDKKKLVLVEHFHSNGHDFNSNVQFTMPQRIERNVFGNFIAIAKKKKKKKKTRRENIKKHCL